MALRGFLSNSAMELRYQVVGRARLVVTYLLAKKKSPYRFFPFLGL